MNVSHIPPQVSSQMAQITTRTKKSLLHMFNTPKYYHNCLDPNTLNRWTNLFVRKATRTQPKISSSGGLNLSPQPLN
eukprot:jgi/Psemu1/311503/fgenesh1_kg.783_\